MTIPNKESDKIEFKPLLNNAVIETLVAFSNAKGGSVYAGVADNSDIIGVTLGKETIPQFINEVKSKTLPSIIPDVEIIDVNNKKVVVLSVAEYPIKPVSVQGKYYKRINASNHLLSADEIANEHLKTINSSWDFHTDANHSEADLSKEKIAKFVNTIRQNDGIMQSGLSDMEILNKMEFLRNGRITFGAYLLFAKDYCTISDVQIGRFKSDITIIDSLSLNSDLFKETDDIIAFIKKHLKVEYIITGEPQRTERFDYPLDAIREIVVNMIVHRDYRDSSASIIKIFDDRIEFYNPGKLYGGITIQDLLSGNYISRSRNKLIARAFKEAGIIERYGSGIMRVRKICKEYGVKEPDFNEISNGFQVILYNEKVVEKTTESVEKTAESVGKTAESVEKTAESVEKTAESVEKILRLISSNPEITQKELAVLTGLSRRGIEKNIAKLKAQNLIERIGPDRGGYWKVNK